MNGLFHSRRERSSYRTPQRLVPKGKKRTRPTNRPLSAHVDGFGKNEDSGCQRITTKSIEADASERETIDTQRLAIASSNRHQIRTNHATPSLTLPIQRSTEKDAGS